MKVLYTGNDSAQETRLSPQGWRNIVGRGDISPVAVTPKGIQLFDPQDVKAYAERRKQKQAAGN